MTIRERMEQEEYRCLSPMAQKAAETKGRLFSEEENDLRTCYQRDADRITHSKSFRRLMHKTQVFLSPEGDHYRTRMTHTLEVARIARTICRGLQLNEDLAEAAALGHDLGHTPFGHAGERALSQMLGHPFRHNEQSLRVVDKLEHSGDGLNLTYEVRMGIVGHTGDFIPETLEGQVLRISDRIAYINHDIDDSIRAGIIRPDDIPKELRDVLGDSHSHRINTMVTATIDGSRDKNDIMMTPEVGEATDKLRDFLFENVYYNPKAKSEETKAKTMLESLFDYFTRNPEKMPGLYRENLKNEPVKRCVCDYISSMTDRYAIDLYRDLFIPHVWETPLEEGR